MKILIFGSGVLGCLYGAMLQEVGHEVTMLARGKAATQLTEKGIVLQEAAAGQHTVTAVRVVERLLPEDAYDLVLVTVRKNQLTAVLPILAANRCTPIVLFLVNNASGPGEIIAALGQERALLGFPGAGGERVDGVIRYHIVPGYVQPTTIGELDGKLTPRLREISGILQKAGFPVAQCRNMDHWLKTHVAWVSPVANAIYLAGGDNYRLAHTRDGILRMVRAIRESFAALHALEIRVTPARLRLLEWIPEPILVALWQKVLNTPFAEVVIARHANAARDEMIVLAEELDALARSAGVETPNLDYLCQFLDPSTAALPAGSQVLSLNWRGVWIGLGFLGGLILLFRRLSRGPRSQLLH